LKAGTGAGFRKELVEYNSARQTGETNIAGFVDFFASRLGVHLR